MIKQIGGIVQHCQVNSYDDGKSRLNKTGGIYGNDSSIQRLE